MQDIVVSDRSETFLEQALGLLGLRSGKSQNAGAASGPTGESAGYSAVDLAAALDDPVLLIDPLANVTFANSSATQAFGTFTLGRSLFLRFRAPEIRELVEGVLASGQTAYCEFAERLPIERAYKVFAAPVGAGTSLFAVVFKDQSETRRIDRMRADFIANASHELRTPLASISGFIETLRGPARNDPKAQAQFLDIMQAQTARMARLIDDLLSLSRLEMKSRIDPARTVDLKALLDRVVDTLTPMATEVSIIIERRFGAGRIIVAGDADELTQVFENLIENACKYGQSGGRVIVSIELASDEVQISITDFGPGIADEHIPRVTERFYRVEQDGVPAQKGTGLGLAIVKHILTRHGGRLSIRSKIGEGTTFTVHLPHQDKS
ncbi:MULTISPECIES: ATP-binding protein [Mesorhizobium]|nr:MULTISPECIES: ATP-binding protein [Mesorhizobium]